MNRASRDKPLGGRAACSAVCMVVLIAAWTIRSSVTASPSSVATAWPRDITITRSHSPSSSMVSLEATTTGTPPGGDFPQDAVDLRTRADVDALRRLVRDENRRLGEHRARHHDLLLVAAGERRDGRLERRRLDRQLGELAFDGGDLARAC